MEGKQTRAAGRVFRLGPYTLFEIALPIGYKMVIAGLFGKGTIDIQIGHEMLTNTGHVE